MAFADQSAGKHRADMVVRDKRNIKHEAHIWAHPVGVHSIPSSGGGFLAEPGIRYGFNVLASKKIWVVDK